jgi:hypothetical protein
MKANGSESYLYFRKTKLFKWVDIHRIINNVM